MCTVIENDFKHLLVMHTVMCCPLVLMYFTLAASRAFEISNSSLYIQHFRWELVENIFLTTRLNVRM